MPHAHFVYGDDYLGTLLSTVRAWGEPGTTQIILCENPTDPEGIGILRHGNLFPGPERRRVRCERPGMVGPG
jgi:hypothetical protein